MKLDYNPALIKLTNSSNNLVSTIFKNPDGSKEENIIGFEFSIDKASE